MKRNRLRGLMVEKGYTQQKMADKLGMTTRTFQNKMKKGVFGTDEAALLAEILEMEDPSDIFFGTE